MATTLQDSGEGQVPSFPNTNSSKTSFDLEPNPFERSFATKDHPNNSNAPNIPAGSPNILTPGGRKLPPLVLSPNVQSSWTANNFGRTGLTPNESGLRTGLTPGGPGIHSLNGISLPGLNTPGSLGFSGFTPGLSSILGAGNDHSNQLGLSATNGQAQQHHMQQNGTNGAIKAEPIHSTHTSNGPSLHQSPVQNLQTQPPQTQAVQAQAQLPVQVPEQTNVPKPDPKIPEPSKRGRKKGSTNKNTKAKAAAAAAAANGNGSEHSSDEGPKRKKAKNASELKSNTTVDSTTSLNDEDDDNEDDDKKTEHMTEAEKRKHFLERNRVAASKCRQRKKQLMAKMETDLNFYLNEYNNLTATIDQLKDQSVILRTYLLNNNKNLMNQDIIHSVENLLTIINQSNYMSRLRGNAPSDIIPTVQPINPSLVQVDSQPIQQRQSQPQNAFVQPQPQIPHQLPPQQQPQELVQNSLPNTVANSVANSLPGSNNNSSTNLQAMNSASTTNLQALNHSLNNSSTNLQALNSRLPQGQLLPNGASTSAPPAMANGTNGVNLALF